MNYPPVVGLPERRTELTARHSAKPQETGEARAVGIGFRSFVFGEDGSLWRLPEQLGSALAVGQIRLPEFANQTWRVASVVLETESGKPVGVIRITGTLWRFDERRGARRNLAQGAIEALGMHRESEEEAVGAGGNIVDISRKIRRRRWWAEHRWEPTPAEITRMINTIWPKAAGRPVEALRSIETSWKRRKPVSRHAGWVVDRCREHVYEIRRELTDLSEPDLNGVMIFSFTHLRRSPFVGVGQTAGEATMCGRP
jgi:hypothetical protein